MLNRCDFIGRLGSDCEVKFAQSGTQVTTFSIACSEKYKNKAGEQVEETEWVRTTTFGKLAEICGNYLSKGSLVYISGKMKTDKYEQDGVTKYSTNIIARDMKMLSPKSDNGGGYSEPPQEPFGGMGGGTGDDVPF